MQKSFLYPLALLLAACIALYSCTKKVNGINNNTVVETPYSLYFSDTAGSLYNSNDGMTVKTIFKADGFPCRAICTVNSNILWAKTNLYISTNNGKNFNQAYDSLASYPFKTCDSSLTLDLNQTMIINLPDWGQVFTVSNSPAYNNFLGVVFSLNVGGVRGSWWFDIPDTAVPPSTDIGIGNYGSPGDVFHISMTSFTYMTNGVLAGYDAIHNRNFYRTQHTLWHECSANPNSADWPGIGRAGDYSGTPLPHRVYYPAGGSSMDTTAWWSYGHIHNRLIAIDSKNCFSDRAYYSDDTGRTWVAYAGLPMRPLLCVASPFEEITLIGTDSAGLYQLNTNTGMWEQQRNNGLGSDLVVRSIAAKENIYKNGNHLKYIYLATNKGIYQSVDGGHNWSLTIPGNYVAVY